MPNIVLPTIFNNPLLPYADRVICADDFERANAALLGSTPKGALPWEVSPSGTGYISGGKAYVVGNTTEARGTAVVDAGTTDVVIEGTVATTPLLNFTGFVLRYVDISNYLMVVAASQTGIPRWSAYQRQSGTGTHLNGIVNSVTPTIGDRIRIEAQGSAVRWFANNTLCGSISTTLFAGNTKVGFLGGGSATPLLVDDFKVWVPGAWRG